MRLRASLVLSLVLACLPAVGGQVRIPDPQGVPTDYVERGLSIGSRLHGATPTATSVGDLDGDGVPDLVCGYSGASGHLLAVHRGNVDALFPNAPAARARRAAGILTDSPFLRVATVRSIAARPDFLAVGDFDADGRSDVVLATVGGDVLRLLPGDGRGGLGVPRDVRLPGSVTALAAGEIHRADGLPDLVVGVRDGEHSSALVFQAPSGAFGADPEIHDVAAPVASLVLGRITGRIWHDLVIAAGPELIVVPGRDRRLLLEPSERGDPTGTTPDSIELPATVESIAWGDVLAAGDGRRELSVLLDDGTIRAFTRTGDGWRSLAEHRVPRPHSRGTLLTARWSGSGTEDLVVVDRTGPSMHVLAASEHDPSAAFETVATKHLERDVASVAPMRLGRHARKDLVLLEAGAGAPSTMEGGTDSTIIVDTALDNAVPGDGVCSLREALNNANADLDGTAGDCAAGSGVDAIEFRIAGGGATATIAVGSALPTVTDPVVIDGTTQGCPSPPCVALDGSGAGVDIDGLTLGGGASTVRGMVVHGFSRHGIFVTSADNVVEGNFSGTDLTGSVDLGNNNAGVRCDGAAAVGNLIGGTTPAARNVLSGNDGAGAIMINSAHDNRVVGNYVGTDMTGKLAIGNSGIGIGIQESTNVTVGGTAPGARNVVCANGGGGVRMFLGGDGGLVQGNYIGVDVDGSVALGNGSIGVSVNGPGSNNTFGGTTPAARNVVSGNASDGFAIFFSQSTGNEILGNYIGTDVTGGVDLGNTLAGVEIEDAAGNVVGGAVPGAGNLISGNTDRGILLQTAADNQVLGNLIGTDAGGTADLGNDLAGVHILGGSGNVVGGTSPDARNVISGNERDGVFINTLSSGNRILGNFVGTDVTGTLDLGNGLAGVEIDGASTNNTVGGTAPGARNVISGNDDRGVLIESSSNNVVLGNYIGTDVTGTMDVGNALAGVAVAFGSSNTVGGTEPGSRNVISGNDEHGVRIHDSNDNVVVGNFIGTDATGSAALGNTLGGLRIQAGSTGNRVGGATPAERNVLSGNDTNGVALIDAGTTSNRIVGNCIGTDAGCRNALPNATRGVYVHLDAQGNEIGGTLPGEGNVIGHHAQAGVVVTDAGIGNSILGNSIWANASLGIDLQEDGVTANDTKDPDAGPNELQNYPVLSLADATPSPDVTIEGSLNSTGNDTFRIEFFASAACDGSGHGQGERYLGSTTASTGGQGNVSFNATLLTSVSDGEAITATATSPLGSTSEYSACVTASCTSVVEFGESLRAADRDTLVWATARDVRFAKGDLTAVGAYGTTDDGTLLGANALDVSQDLPAPGEGLYYLVKPLGCGSWQTSAGAQPGRDAALP